jgi:hypothetical protein
MKFIITFYFAFVWYLVSHIKISAVKPACNGTAKDRILFTLQAGSILFRIEGNPDRLNYKHLPVKTGFRYAQVPFKTGFTVYIGSIDCTALENQVLRTRFMLSGEEVAG